MCDSPLLVPLSHTHKHTHANKTIHQSFPIHSASKEADSSSRSTSFSQFRGVRRSVSLFMWVIYTAQFNLTHTPTIVANLWCIAEDLSLTFFFQRYYFTVEHAWCLHLWTDVSITAGCTAGRARVCILPHFTALRMLWICRATGEKKRQETECRAVNLRLQGEETAR